MSLNSIENSKQTFCLVIFDALEFDIRVNLSFRERISSFDFC